MDQEPTTIMASLMGRPLTRTETALVKATVQLISNRSLLRACDRVQMEADADLLLQATR